MAKCECGALWFWNKCYSTFVDDCGDEYSIQELENFRKEGNAPEGMLNTAKAYRCQCGKINCIIIDGEFFFDTKEFKDVDWEKI